MIERLHSADVDAGRIVPEAADANYGHEQNPKQRSHTHQPRWTSTRNDFFGRRAGFSFVTIWQATR